MPGNHRARDRGEHLLRAGERQVADVEVAGAGLDQRAEWSRATLPLAHRRGRTPGSDSWTGTGGSIRGVEGSGGFALR